MMTEISHCPFPRADLQSMSLLEIQYLIFFFHLCLSWSQSHTLWKRKKKGRSNCVTIIPSLIQLCNVCGQMRLEPNQIARTAHESLEFITWQPVYSWGDTSTISPCPWRINWLNVFLKDLILWFFSSLHCPLPGLCTEFVLFHFA